MKNPCPEEHKVYLKKKKDNLNLAHSSSISERGSGLSKRTTTKNKKEKRKKKKKERIKKGKRGWLKERREEEEEEEKKKKKKRWRRGFFYRFASLALSLIKAEKKKNFFLVALNQNGKIITDRPIGLHVLFY